MLLGNVNHSKWRREEPGTDYSCSALGQPLLSDGMIFSPGFSPVLPVSGALVTPHLVT